MTQPTLSWLTMGHLHTLFSIPAGLYGNPADVPGISHPESLRLKIDPNLTSSLVTILPAEKV